MLLLAGTMRHLQELQSCAILKCLRHEGKEAVASGCFPAFGDPCDARSCNGQHNLQTSAMLQRYRHTCRALSTLSLVTCDPAEECVQRQYTTGCSNWDHVCGMTNTSWSQAALLGQRVCVCLSALVADTIGTNVSCNPSMDQGGILLS